MFKQIAIHKVNSFSVNSTELKEKNSSKYTSLSIRPEEKSNDSFFSLFRKKMLDHFSRKWHTELPLGWIHFCWNTFLLP